MFYHHWIFICSLTIWLLDYFFRVLLQYFMVNFHLKYPNTFNRLPHLTNTLVLPCFILLDSRVFQCWAKVWLGIKHTWFRVNQMRQSLQNWDKTKPKECEYSFAKVVFFFHTLFEKFCISVCGIQCFTWSLQLKADWGYFLYSDQV